MLLLQASVLPDSPRWLLAHGRDDEATEVLARLADAEIDAPEVLQKRNEITDALKLESAGGMCPVNDCCGGFGLFIYFGTCAGPFRYKELLEGGKIGNFRRIVLCAAIQFMQVRDAIGCVI